MSLATCHCDGKFNPPLFTFQWISCTPPLKDQSLAMANIMVDESKVEEARILLPRLKFTENLGENVFGFLNDETKEISYNFVNDESTEEDEDYGSACKKRKVKDKKKSGKEFKCDFCEFRSFFYKGLCNHVAQKHKVSAENLLSRPVSLKLHQHPRDVYDRVFFPLKHDIEIPEHENEVSEHESYLDMSSEESTKASHLSSNSPGTVIRKMKAKLTDLERMFCFICSRNG